MFSSLPLQDTDASHIKAFTEPVQDTAFQFIISFGFLSLYVHLHCTKEKSITESNPEQ
jgi:hypothetical protein